MKTRAFRFANFFLIALFFLLPLSTAQALPGSPVQPYLPAGIAPGSTLAAIFNTNLIPDGDAEQPYSTYWVDNEGFTQILLYGAAVEECASFQVRTMQVLPGAAPISSIWAARITIRMGPICGSRTASRWLRSRQPSTPAKCATYFPAISVGKQPKPIRPSCICSSRPTPAFFERGSHRRQCYPGRPAISNWAALPGENRVHSARDPGYQPRPADWPDERLLLAHRVRR